MIIKEDRVEETGLGEMNIEPQVQTGHTGCRGLGLEKGSLDWSLEGVEVGREELPGTGKVQCRYQKVWGGACHHPGVWKAGQSCSEDAGEDGGWTWVITSAESGLTPEGI